MYDSRLVFPGCDIDGEETTSRLRAVLLSSNGFVWLGIEHVVARVIGLSLQCRLRMCDLALVEILSTEYNCGE